MNKLVALAQMILMLLAEDVDGARGEAKAKAEEDRYRRMTSRQAPLKSR